jgi:hypothetical protein
MKFQLIIAALALGLASTASANKVAEYGDPVIGNTYGGCVFNPGYSTGGLGYLYNEYNIVCPTGTYRVGVSTSWPNSSPWGSGSPQCTFYPPAGYYMSGDCKNWRLYRN